MAQLVENSNYVAKQRGRALQMLTVGSKVRNKPKKQKRKYEPLNLIPTKKIYNPFTKKATNHKRISDFFRAGPSSQVDEVERLEVVHEEDQVDMRVDGQ